MKDLSINFADQNCEKGAHPFDRIHAVLDQRVDGWGVENGVT